MSGPTHRDDLDAELLRAVRELPVPVPAMPALRRPEPAPSRAWVLYTSIVAGVATTVGMGLDRALDARLAAILLDVIARGLASSVTGAALIAIASGIVGGAVTLLAGGGRTVDQADGVGER